ncbi:MAG: hypothetical protein Q8K99_06945 [Actinomycetota bacterium]|nr:hypothetical protein [Actinomycetota bacterium]
MRTYYYNGGYQSVYNRGVAASIESQNPVVGGGDASSSAWVMICKLAGGTGYEYMQIGWTEDHAVTGEVPRFFWECSNSYYDWDIVYGSLSGSSGTHSFKITDDATNYYLQIDGSTKTTKAKSTVPWTPNAIEIFGETYYQTDQCPGTTSNHCSFGPVSYKTTSGVWAQASVTEDIDLSTMANDLQNGERSWTIWDTRY